MWIVHPVALLIAGRGLYATDKFILLISCKQSLSSINSSNSN